MDLSPSQQEAFTWFRKSQLQAVIKDGIVPQWFHGIISRKAAEELLMSKPPGYFLIRVSESRIGYTLSYRDETRCKHFMIDAVEDGYVILGEKKHHHLLHDLVDYHRQTPIFPFSELLTMPCGQKSDISADYDELLFPVRQQNPTLSSPQNKFMQPKKSDPVPQQATPSALPDRPNNLMDSAVPSPNIQPARLYPSLDENIILNNISLGPDVPVPAHRKRYSANPITPSQPPELPSRALVSTQNQPSIYASVNPPTDSLHLAPNTQSVSSQDAKTSVVTNLKNFKKNFLKKRSSSQDCVYEEIKVEDTQERDSPNSSDNYLKCQKTTDQQTIHGDPQSSVTLPQEYRPPPPFAPGYI